MYDSFSEVPDMRPFKSGSPNVVPATNPSAGALNDLQDEWALALARMDFSSPDVEPNRPLLNRAIWYATKGFATPYPGDRTVLRPDDVRRLGTADT
jgi:hypothetical protein